jgi:hypothetical protein
MPSFCSIGCRRNSRAPLWFSGEPSVMNAVRRKTGGGYAGAELVHARALQTVRAEPINQELSNLVAIELDVH